MSGQVLMENDRDVELIIRVKASQVEDVRDWTEALRQFPAYCWRYADQIQKLLTKPETSPKDGEELAELVDLLMMDCVSADQTLKQLFAITKGVHISDPDAAKEPLQ